MPQPRRGRRFTLALRTRSLSLRPTAALMDDSPQRARRSRSRIPRWMPFRPDPEKDRYYLLPGMGGRALRRKQRKFLTIATIVGLLAALALGYLIYRANVR